MTRRFLESRSRRVFGSIVVLVAVFVLANFGTVVWTQGAPPAQAPPASAQAPAPGAQGPGAPAPAAGGFGGGRAMTSEATDFTPKAPYLPRTGAEEAKSFLLPTGYRMELVAADPDVISPSVIEFDGNGRMYVGEMISYMMDANASREHDPISRISRWESTKQ